MFSILFGTKVHRKRVAFLLSLIFACSMFSLPSQISEAAPASAATIPGAYTATWVGASSQDTDTTTAPPMQALGMYTGPDGNCYTAASWDESGPNGTVVTADGKLTGINLGVTGDGAIAANSSYVYSQAGHTGFAKCKKTGGRVKNVDCGTWVDGIAATESEVFVSCPDANLVKVYDAKSMAFKSQFSVSQPRRSVAAPDGSLWVISGKVPRIDNARDVKNYGCSILHISSTGKVIAAIKGLQRPRGLAIMNNKLYVAEDGTDQNFKIYSNVSSLKGTVTPKNTNFGAVGGVFEGKGANTGKTGPLRFNHPTGVGVDSKGNIYTSEWATYTGGGMILSKYSPSGNRLWVVYGLCFEDGLDFDPTTDGVDLYDKCRHYKMDYSKGPGQEWSLVGYTHNRYKYDFDMRSSFIMDNPGNTWVKVIQGRKLLFVTRQTRGDIQVFRFEPSTNGETAIPCGLIADIHEPYDNSKGWPRGGLEWDGIKEPVWTDNQPPIREKSDVWNDGYIWCDLDGDTVPDANEFTQPNGPAHTWTATIGNNGDLWMQNAARKGLVKVPFQGFTSAGVPKWDYTKSRQFNLPVPFNSVVKLEYDSDNDVMFLTGYINNESADDGVWLGKTVARYDKWNANAGNWKAAWTTHIPYYIYTAGNSGLNHSASHVPTCFTIAGDFIFYSYYGGIDAGGIYVMRKSDGAYIGKMLSEYEFWDTDEIYCIRAFKRSNGEYVVSLNHHSHASIGIYRWMPPKGKLPAMESPEPSSTKPAAPEVPAPTPRALPVGATRYEAEKGVLNGCEVLSEVTASEGKAINKLDKKGDSVQLNVNAAKEGRYALYLGYGCVEDSQVSIYVNGSYQEAKKLTSTGARNNYQNATPLTVNLKAGSNTIKVQLDAADFGAPEMDYIDIQPPLDAKSKIEAESFTDQAGVQTEGCAEGGDNVGYIENGDYMVYENVDFGSGVKTLQARVATQTDGGNMEIRIDSPTGTLLGTLNVPSTGDWQKWETKTCDVKSVTGVHKLYLTFKGNDGFLFNINWIQFSN